MSSSIFYDGLNFEGKNSEEAVKKLTNYIKLQANISGQEISDIEIKNIVIEALENEYGLDEFDDEDRFDSVEAMRDSEYDSEDEDFYDFQIDSDRELAF